MISEYVLHSQKGVYGAADALRATGAEGDPGEYMQKFSLEYVRLILQRSSFYRVDTLGIADSVGLSTYFFCGFTVVFLLLSVLPFAAMFVHRDHSVGQVLSANGVGALRQVFGEFSALLFVVVLSLFSAVALPLAITLFGGSVPVEGTFSILSFLSALPVAVAVCGMSLFLFECARDTVSGVLLHFFLSLSLCYVGGCFYPVFMFPDTVQALSRFLPTGIARAHLAASLSDGDLLRGTGALCLYGMFFFFLTVLLRRRKLISGGR